MKKILRFLFKAFVVATVVAGVLLIVALSPIVQTWLVRRSLAEHPELHATVESVWAGWSDVELEGVAVEHDGARFTARKIVVELPVWTALRERKFPVRRLVAKDWSVKWIRAAATEAAMTTATAGAGNGGTEAGVAKKETATNATTKVPTPAEVFAGLLGGLEWPADLAVAEVDLEGELLATAPGGQTTTQVHVTLKGGALAAGTTGKFALEATVFDDRLPGNTQSVRGDLAATLGADRRLARLDLKGELAAGNRPPAPGTGWGVTLGVAREPQAETYRLALDRGGRSLARVEARWTAAARDFSGEWEFAARAEDFTALGAEGAVPVRAEGRGSFAAAVGFAAVRATGRIAAAAERWPAALAPWLEPLGPTELTVEFAAARRGAAVHFDKLDGTLAGARPLVTWRAVQAFDVAAHDGALAVTTADPAADWLDVTVQRWPLRELVAGTKDWAVVGGDVAGRLAVGCAESGFTVRTLGPLTSAGLAVEHAGRRVRGIEGAVAGTARRATTGAWDATLAPLVLTSGGRELLKIEGKLTQPAEAGQAVAVAVHADADLPAIRATAETGQLGWLTARTATAEITGTIAGYADLLAKVKVVGGDPTHTLETTLRADLYPDGTVSFGAPLKLASGKDVSELRVDWEWRGDAPSQGVDLKLAGPQVSLAHLRWLAAPLVARGDAAKAGPFWGDWTGRVRVDLEHVRLPDRELIDVGGYLKVEPGGIELMGGHGGPPEHSLAQLEATLTYDPARAQPYELKAAAGAYHTDEEKILGKMKDDKEPAFTGRFTVERSVKARGASFEELLAQREEEFKLKAENGIVRGLKTGVAQALPPPPEMSGVTNALDNVGTGFARLLGAKTKSLASGQVKVGAVKEAVLDYDRTMAEIGYDSLTITAVQRADGTVSIKDVELISPELHFSGSGGLGGTKETALLERPVKAELAMGAKGRMAELLTKAGLLAAEKDALGYARVEPAISFGGTLGQLTQDAWRARLVAAAQRPEPPEKKAAEPAKKERERGH